MAAALVDEEEELSLDEENEISASEDEVAHTHRVLGSVLTFKTSLG